MSNLRENLARRGREPGTADVLPTHEVPELSPSVISVVEEAYEDALGRISPDASQRSPDAVLRVEEGLEKRFLPYVAEVESIAKQTTSEEYVAFTKEINEFLGAKVGFVLCPDGRILHIALAGPGIASFHRRLQGLPQTRSSTSDGRAVLDDPFLAAAITTDLEDRAQAGEEEPEMIEFVGPHIDSDKPITHGCGKRRLRYTPSGRPLTRAMNFGGIADYFAELDEGFEAFNHVAETVYGKPTTYDIVFDTYSQGFIVGLRDEINNFNERFDLRQNLEFLHRNGKILMTEHLDVDFRQRILNIAEEMGIQSLNFRDYRQLAKNTMIIGKIAKELTIEESQKDYSFMPDKLKSGKSETAKRVLSYHALRNVAYRVLGNIMPGKHSLVEHPEKLIQVGPIGARANVDTIPFIQTTSGGELKNGDIEAVVDIYGLSEGVLEAQNISLNDEARIIVVTGKYNQRAYSNDRYARTAFNEAASIVLNNAARLRKQFEEGIPRGEVVVIAALFNPETGKLTHIISHNGSRGKNDKSA